MDKPFKCDSCDKSFKFPSRLKYHIMIHEGKGFSCELCGKTYSTYENLKKHMKITHDVGELAPEKRILKCDKCQIDFQSAVTMDEHFKTQCQDNITKQTIEFECKFCSAKWISHHSLELHIMEVHGKRLFSCDQCSYVSDIRATVESHHDALHKNLKRHICHHCGQAYNENRLLKKHLFKKHNEGSPSVIAKHQCNECGKCYESWKGLTTHIRTNHDKSVSYQCHICSKSFLDKGYLQAHVRFVHEKQRPNKCDLCPEAFITKRDLKKHKEKHGIY